MGRFIDLSGCVFGNLTVIERSGPGNSGATMWVCACYCGNTCIKDSSALRRGLTKSCGCLNFENLAGTKFGRLTPIERNGVAGNRGVKWLCRCDCGNHVTVAAQALKCGATRSCGCFQKEDVTKRTTTHGLSGTPEYRIWNSMLVRCNDLENGGRPRYGGRGIKVCERWRNSFQSFYDDMGPRPDGLTIERINNDGDYEPGNCVWADRSVQSANQGLRSDNKTGVRGVSRLKTGRYFAELIVKGEKVLKREFNTFEEAVEARQKAEYQYR